MELTSLLTGRSSERVTQVLKAADHAILSGSVMVGAIGLGRGGLGGFVLLLLAALVLSAIAVYLLLLTVVFPLVLRRPQTDALSIALYSMLILPLIAIAVSGLIFGVSSGGTSRVIMLPVFIAVGYGVLIGGHLHRLEKKRGPAEHY